MKAGDLCKIALHRWLLPHSGREFWKNCGFILYLGEDVIKRDDGITIVNHGVLARGEYRVVDASFLRLLESANESR